MAIDYRYHIGSLVSIFVALLLGILIGIGLAPKDPEYVNQVASQLRQEYNQTRLENEKNLQAKEDELQQVQHELDESDAVGREAVAAVIAGRLAGKRIALVLDHGLGRDLPDNLRATLTQAGAKVISTTTIGSDFVQLSPEVRDAVCSRLLLYLPADTPVRPILARFLAQDFARGQGRFVTDLQSANLLRCTAGSDYTSPVDAVLVVGGMDAPADAMPEQIDVPLIKELVRLGVRVVGCEQTNVKLSVIPTYKALGIPTVDDIDSLAGRLSLVLTLGGVEGHFGVKKETADRLLPTIPPAM